MATPPAYLLHDFDPRAVKVAELRGILLAHDVSYRTAPRGRRAVRSVFSSLGKRRPLTRLYLPQIQVPYASNAKKAVLIAAYEKSIRPRAPVSTACDGLPPRPCSDVVASLRSA